MIKLLNFFSRGSNQENSDNTDVIEEFQENFKTDNDILWQNRYLVDLQYYNKNVYEKFKDIIVTKGNSVTVKDAKQKWYY